MVELRGQKLVKLLLEIKRELDVISVYLIGTYVFIFWRNIVCMYHKPGPLKKWTDHSQELHLLKIHSRWGSYYTRGLDEGWFFGPWAFIILKTSNQDLSNEGSKKNWVHWNLFFKLLKHRHFQSSLNFLQRNEKYRIGSCPHLLYA